MLVCLCVALASKHRDLTLTFNITLLVVVFVALNKCFFLLRCLVLHRIVLQQAASCQMRMRAFTFGLVCLLVKCTKIVTTVICCKIFALSFWYVCTKIDGGVNTILAFSGKHR